jgi:hypothetical protein
MYVKGENLQTFRGTDTMRAHAYISTLQPMRELLEYMATVGRSGLYVERENYETLRKRADTMKSQAYIQPRNPYESCWNSCLGI